MIKVMTVDAVKPMPPDAASDATRTPRSSGDALIDGMRWRDDQRIDPSLYRPNSESFAAAYEGHGVDASPFVEIGPSIPLCKVDQPIEFGLFAKKFIPKGTEIVAIYGGIVRNQNEVAKERRHHSRRIPGTDKVLDGIPLSDLLPRIVPRSDEEIAALSRAPKTWFRPSRAYGADIIALFRETPPGYMINSAGSGRANVIHQSGPRIGVDGIEGYVIIAVAVEDILQGHELLTMYHSNEEKAGFEVNQFSSK